jgi:3D (Asp-Asp-Asp) domain-containing protein
VEGLTVAADWAVFAPGDVVRIDGLPGIGPGHAHMVQDRGSGVVGPHLDVYFTSCADAGSTRRYVHATLVRRGSRSYKGGLTSP